MSCAVKRACGSCGVAITSPAGGLLGLMRQRGRHRLLELLLPDLHQQRHGRQAGGLTGDIRPREGVQQMKTIGSDLQRQRLLLLFGPRQAKAGQDQAVALVPVRLARSSAANRDGNPPRLPAPGASSRPPTAPGSATRSPPARPWHPSVVCHPCAAGPSPADAAARAQTSAAPRHADPNARETRSAPSRRSPCPPEPSAERTSSQSRAHRIGRITIRQVFHELKHRHQGQQVGDTAGLP